jgi:hypothetical protein
VSPEHQNDDPVNSAPPTDEEIFGYETLDPELVTATAQLLANVTGTTAWNLEAFMQHTRVYEELSMDIERAFDVADSYGDQIDPDIVEDLLETLDAITEKLFAIEQDELLAEETFTYARSEYPAEPGDDKIVTAGIRVCPISFGRPRPHVLHMLLRQLTGKRFDGGYRIMTMPRWLYRRIELYSEHTRIWIVALLEGVPTGEVLEVANSLWEPHTEGAYQSPVSVLEAARLLEA